MTLEELSIIYTADAAPAVQEIRRLMDVLYDASREAEQLAADFSASGVRAGEGLEEGILSSRERVMAAAREVANAAAAALRAALEIHSPSRVTMDAGAQFASGLYTGMMQSADTAFSGLNLLQTPVSMPSGAGFDSPVEKGDAGDIHITVPLEVDGYQLGMAAIENINRVSRMTGRAELSI
ncbi:MAG: hypothetical protein IKT57_05895 [Clostridia bacterium]|nr:hypothetical protein [Clostridia bacterium]